MPRNRNRIGSSVHIARLLDSEGFSDHIGNMVERYWVRNIARNRKRHRKLDADVAEICKRLTDGEKLILGKFIALHKRMSFDTGLRIGLTTFARKIDKEYQLNEVSTEEREAETLKSSQDDDSAKEVRPVKP
jgi:hypothetical protein